VLVRGLRILSIILSIICVARHKALPLCHVDRSGRHLSLFDLRMARDYSAFAAAGHGGVQIGTVTFIATG